MIWYQHKIRIGLTGKYTPDVNCWCVPTDSDAGLSWMHISKVPTVRKLKKMPWSPTCASASLPGG